jgi:hypothetical protein
MKSKLVTSEAEERLFILVLDEGKEAFAAITRFASEEDLAGASVTGPRWAGSTSPPRPIAPSPLERAERVDEQCEVLSILDDIATGEDGKPSLHVHAVLGLSDGTTRGGHLLAGFVRPTLEVTIIESPTHLRRRKRADLGIALIDLS